MVRLFGKIKHQIRLKLKLQNENTNEKQTRWKNEVQNAKYPQAATHLD